MHVFCELKVAYRIHSHCTGGIGGECFESWLLFFRSARSPSGSEPRRSDDILRNPLDLQLLVSWLLHIICYVMLVIRILF